MSGMGAVASPHPPGHIYVSEAGVVSTGYAASGVLRVSKWQGPTVDYLGRSQ